MNYNNARLWTAQRLRAFGGPYKLVPTAIWIVLDYVEVQGSYCKFYYTSPHFEISVFISKAYNHA